MVDPIADPTFSKFRTVCSGCSCGSQACRCIDANGDSVPLPNLAIAISGTFYCFEFPQNRVGPTDFHEIPISVSGESVCGGTQLSTGQQLTGVTYSNSFVLNDEFYWELDLIGVAWGDPSSYPITSAAHQLKIGGFGGTYLIYQFGVSFTSELNCPIVDTVSAPDLVSGRVDTPAPDLTVNSITLDYA